MYNHLDESVKS
jgi:hypothetical protein